MKRPGLLGGGNSAGKEFKKFDYVARVESSGES